MTTAQHSLLRWLHRNGIASDAAVRKVGASPGSTMKTIDALMRRGYVTCTQEGNQRVPHYTLTSKGRRLVAKEA
jgi:DNA-binding MarR family transcriptional regulator